ncbi:Uncharacterised protein [Vibrio cholerae]|nr:Uncharacterised protein [Vibrio cholerae]
MRIKLIRARWPPEICSGNEQASSVRAIFVKAA